MYFDQHPELIKLINELPHRTMIIVRGISGAGKTTLAETIRRMGHFASSNIDIHAGDDFFTDADGNYVFDPKLLGQAHQQCLWRTLRAIQSCKGYNNAHTIVLHNTATRLWEYQTYVTLAECTGYEVRIIDLLADTTDAIKTCAARCTKDGLRLEDVAAQALRFEPDKRALTIRIS